jgi:predicted hotdog family 3-hydroxylacyl-ACP dehydratase
MLPTKNIENLIPQRAPFVMVDTLMKADETKAESAFTILENNVLVNEGVLTEAGIIENIAQTAALHVGYIATKTGDKIPQGMIGGIKNLEINLLPDINSKLLTKISLEHEVMNAKIIHGSVFMNDQEIAQCQMKVFLL